MDMEVEPEVGILGIDVRASPARVPPVVYRCVLHDTRRILAVANLAVAHVCRDREARLEGEDVLPLELSKRLV